MAVTTAAWRAELLVENLVVKMAAWKAAKSVGLLVDWTVGLKVASLVACSAAQLVD